jgi:hypothetical protein
LKAEWSRDWLINFNPAKCSTLHLGRLNDHHSYNLLNQQIANTNQSKDLGVKFESDLSFHLHSNSAVNKALCTLGAIRRTFKHLPQQDYINLYKSKIRSILEYASPVCQPLFKKDMRRLEAVQARATKTHGIHHLPYPERLRKLGLPSLEYRRLRADMVTIYRITHQIDDVAHHDLLPPLSTSTTRGHPFKLTKERTRTTKARNILRHRPIDTWNSLPTEVVTAPSLNAFKNRLNIAWKNHPLKFNPTAY